MRVRRRTGAALLEAIVALAVLGTAGVAALVLVRDAVRTVEHAREAERRMGDAHVFMSAVSLWTREDLDRRLGERPQGPWRLAILRPEPTLYRVTLRDSLSGRVVLATHVYRAPAEATSGTP